VFDAAPIGRSFGQVIRDVNSIPYSAGETVYALFVGANPRVSCLFKDPINCRDLHPLQNNLRLEGTFLTVDQQVNGQWTTVRSDSHPSTTFRWKRTSTVRPHRLRCWIVLTCVVIRHKHSEHLMVRKTTRS
jgi:neutral ceramidase